MKRITLALVLALASAPSLAQNTCIASPPIIPAEGSQFCLLGTYCGSTPEIATRNLLDNAPEIVPVPLTDGARACQAKFQTCGCSHDLANGGKVDWWACYYVMTSNICNTFFDDTCAAPRARQNYLGAESWPRCKPGYVGIADNKCQSQTSIAEDKAAAAAFEDRTVRDANGNPTRIEHPVGTVVATFGDYDGFGRPGWYDDGVNRVTLTWPANGACLFSSLTANGWTSQFSWAAQDEVATLSTAVYSRPGIYSADYYPDGKLHDVWLRLELTGMQLLYSWTYSEPGELLATTRHTLPLPVPVSAAATEAAAVAADPLVPDARFQPKVVIVRPVGIQGGAALELFGPLSVLYPTFDYLGRQIAQFYMHASASNDEALNDKCALQQIGDERACKAFWSDRGLDANNLPTSDTRAWHHDCMRSARERFKECMSGVARPLDLRLPFSAAVGKLDCERDLATDIARCRVRANELYQVGTPYPHLREAGLFDCVVNSATNERFAQCHAGIPLANRNPLRLPQ